MGHSQGAEWLMDEKLLRGNSKGKQGGILWLNQFDKIIDEGRPMWSDAKMGDKEFDQTDFEGGNSYKTDNKIVSTIGCFRPFKDRCQSPGLEGVEEADWSLIQKTILPLLTRRIVGSSVCFWASRHSSCCFAQLFLLFSPISFCHQTPEASFIKHRSLLVDAMVNARKSLKGQGRGNLTFFFFLGELKQCCFWLCTSFNKITFSSSLLPLPPRQPRHTSMEAEPMTNTSDKMITQSHLSPPTLWVYCGARLVSDSIFLSSLPSHSSDQTPGRLPSGSLHMPRRI